MFEAGNLGLMGIMPLAQMDTTTAPATGGGGGGATSVVPATPAVHSLVAPKTAEVPATQGAAGGGAAMNAGPATTSTSQPAGAAAKETSSSPFGGLIGMLPIILMLVALYFFMMRGQKKEEKRRKGLLAEMKKGDKVQTIGGLIARVVSIDNDEVVLKVDESANVKETYKKSAILNVIVAGEEKK